MSASYTACCSWVNLARRDKDVPAGRAARAGGGTRDGWREGDRTYSGGSRLACRARNTRPNPRRRVGEWSCFHPADPAEFNAFVWMLVESASIGSNRRHTVKSQIAVLGPGAALTVADGTPGVRFMLMSGRPYGEQPIFNGPYLG